MLFSGNGLLAGLRMKRPSIYIDQWTEENCYGRGGSRGRVQGVPTPRPPEYFYNHESIAVLVPCRDGGSEILNPRSIINRLPFCSD